MNPLSLEAFGMCDRDTQRAKVLAAIKSAREGLTVDELAKKWSMTPNQISGRFTELKQLGLVFVRGTRRTLAGSRAGVHWAKSKQRQVNLF